MPPQSSSIFVFLSSPGDVVPEREAVRTAVAAYGRVREKNGHRRVETVAWDAPGLGLALDATVTPQLAINRGMRKPSECDVVFVILWSRMGTRLPPDVVKEDGTRYESGTEWEFLDAVREHAERHDLRPRVFVFRKQGQAPVAPNDPEYLEKGEQWQKVQRFFARFKNEDGSLPGSYYEFQNADELSGRIRGILDEIGEELEQLPPMPRTGGTGGTKIRSPKREDRPTEHLPILNAWSMHVGDRGYCVPAAGGTFYLSTGVSVVVHSVMANDPVARTAMPLQWKQVLPRSWRGRLVISDWDGGVCFFSEGARSELSVPRADDVPVHRLAVDDRSGRLFAAAWDARVRGWDEHGRLLFGVAAAEPGVVIRQLATAPDGRCAVLLANGEMVILQPDGNVERRMAVPPDTRRIWALQQYFVAQVGENTIARLDPADGRSATVNFEQPITATSPRIGRDSDWLVVAQAGGAIDWLPVDSLVIDRTQRIESGLIVSELQAVLDDARPAALIAIGVDSEGRLFLVNNNKLTLYSLPGDTRYEHVVLNDDSRLAYLYGQAGVTAVRTPALSAARSRIRLLGLEGTLVQNEFCRLVVRLENQSAYPLTRVDAQLIAADGTVSNSPISGRMEQPVLPGAEFQLPFSVCPLAVGEITALLRINVADEFGPLQDSQQIEISIHSERER